MTTQTFTQNAQNKTLDAAGTRRAILELRYKIGLKRKDIEKTTNPRLILAMQKDVWYWQGEIARLIAACPKVLGFRDMVDAHMAKGGE